MTAEPAEPHVIAPGCPNCAHIHATGLTCDAFPAGIPLLIAQGDFDHRQPFPDDNGIQWEPGVPEREAGV